MVREKFIFYSNWINAGKSLSDEDRLKFYDRLMNYVGFGIDEPQDGTIEIMFQLIKPQIDLNNERYANGQLGGEFGYLGGRPAKKVKKPIGDTGDNPINNKIKFLDCVFLTQEEYDRLVYDFGKTVIDDRLEDLDAYISNGKGSKYKDHNKTLRQRLKKDGLKKKIHEQQMDMPTTDPFFTSLLGNITGQDSKI